MSWFELVAAEGIIWAPVSFIIGSIVGSFLNVIIYRLPLRMEQELEDACAQQQGAESGEAANKWFGLKFLITPASSCPSCGHRIRAWENIPILSYLLQKGRCTACNASISVQYPIVEFVNGVLTLFVVWHFGPTWSALWMLLLTWSLVAMSVIDIHHQLLPDVLILPLIWLGLLINQAGLFTDLTSALYGAIGGYLFLWFLYHLFLLLRNKEGMGYGDFKLFALFGAWAGWQLLPQILLLSSLVGALVGVSMILFRGRDKSIPIPFGPYLAVAGWIAMLWGREINQTYLQLAGIG